MANPSTVNATASGKEVLRRFHQNDVTTSGIEVINGVADHIYTIISIIVYNDSNTETGLQMFVHPDGVSGDNCYLSAGAANKIPGWSTFVWNDKFVIAGTDSLYIECQSGGGNNLDVWCSYIDQDFT